ncbi:endonuclease III [Rarobacter incanus]|uniref:Endonuclease III n=1 Tax=Rarobacter incanus TaxID=153494 RepID=A0A542SP85_9MICO|nr:endonuclease III [Rarobacter incanus]TQK76434.1 DNA-(apurinic or apyrimidinic site) lyase /endonuclease III [Rarobacter incanus]
MEPSHTRNQAILRAAQIYERLGQAFPDARCELDYSSPWQLLVATVLSAQTTDKRVNAVTPELFARWPQPVDLASADTARVRAVINSLGFGTRRAANIIEMAHQVDDRYGGEVPANEGELVGLAGVGRKTAHVVMAEAFGAPVLAVDTHVMRTARRLGLTSHADPLGVERDLTAIFPARELPLLSHRLIFLGRRVCAARRPNCAQCALAPLCPSASPAPTAGNARGQGAGAPSV